MVPEDVPYQGFRLAKLLDGQVAAQADRAAAARAPGQPPHDVVVEFPADDHGLVLRVQAYDDVDFVAQGEKALDRRASEVVLHLQKCEPKVARASDGLCLQDGARSAPTAATSPADGGPADATPDETDAGEAGVDVATDSATDRALLPCNDVPAVDPVRPLPAVDPHPGCRRYCTAMTTRCPSVYGSEDRCHFACQAIDWPAGTPQDAETGRDSLACRITWAEATAATFDDRRIYCKRASPDSFMACGDTCTVYCRLGARLCSAHFVSEPACLDTCRAVERVVRERYPHATMHEILACHLDQLERAVFNRDRCPAAAPHYKMCGPCWEFPSPDLLLPRR